MATKKTSTQVAAPDFDPDAASLALGKAWGLAHMCCGLAVEPPKEERCDFAHVRGVLRHIASLVGEGERAAAGAPVPVREAIAEARAVSEVLKSDAAVEYAGHDVGQHWNDEITDWALTALCDAIGTAKQAIDARACEEVRHV